MVIVCGVDGSTASREAARAAAAIAKCMRDELRLVYVQEISSLDIMTGATPVPFVNTAAFDEVRERLRAELRRDADRLSSAFHITASVEVRTGLPELELDQAAADAQAPLLVVASLGRRTGSMWRIGSTADRLSQSASVSVLIVRHADPFERWALEGRPLRAVLALGDGPPTEAALAAAGTLRQYGPCDIVEAHVYDPARECSRLGLSDSESAESRRTIESSLARDLPRRFGELRGRGNVSFTALPSRGGTAETLVDFASTSLADLILVGAHGRGALHRRFAGSVSYGVIPLSGTNVLVVHPAREEQAQVASAPVKVSSVLVATDLSEISRRALDLALGVLGESGRLVLFHVEVPRPVPSGLIAEFRKGAHPGPEKRRLNRTLAEAELKKLVPAQQGALEVECEVVEAGDVPESILEAAERHAVDLVCLGTHGRGRVASALLGSVSREVARRSPRPVLLVPPLES